MVTLSEKLADKQSDPVAVIKILCISRERRIERQSDASPLRTTLERLSENMWKNTDKIIKFSENGLLKRR